MFYFYGVSLLKILFCYYAMQIKEEVSEEMAEEVGEDEQCVKYVTVASVDDLYLFMGRELDALHEVPAGNVCG